MPMRIFQLAFVFSFFIIFNSCSKDGEAPDTVPPTVSLTILGVPNASGGEPVVVSNKIEVSVNASDANGVSKIEVYIDNEKKGEDSSAPYQVVIDISSYASNKNYTLKVEATDKAGNTSSTQQTISIDNEIPVVTDVSLVQDSVITGSDNAVTFNVTDNEELSSVMVYVNSELFVDIKDKNYEVNIDTKLLQDGENNLMIEAKDPAGNIGSYTVNFIIDNTGPAITLNSITENKILDEFMLLQPEVLDAYSEVTSVEVFLGDTSIYLFDENSSNYDMDFVPDNYPVGTTVFKLVAIDSLGNESVLEINIEILRLLIKVALPDGFLSPFWSSFWIFASEMNGVPIAAKSVGVGDSNIKIHAPSEFDFDKKYMITLLADENTNPNSFNRITNIQGITRNSLSEINFNLPQRKTVVSNATVSMVGFGTDETVKGDGLDYTFNHYVSESSGNFELTSLNTTANSSSDYFLYSTNLEGIPYAYFSFSEPLANNSTINKTDLITDTAISNATFNITNDPGISSSQLIINGFRTNEDLQNGIYHNIYSGSPQQVFGIEYEYYFCSIFDSYSHQLILDDYLTLRKGLPINTYNIPNWSVDYLQNGNEITITKSGTEHVLGRLQLMPTTGEDYIMTVLFDSQNTDVVTLPQIPEEMKDLYIYTVAQNQGFDMNQIHFSSYNSITSYADYLNNIIKGDDNETDVSDVISTKMKARNGASVTPFKTFNFE
ncbi:Ig-like domain-containing protein [Hwangdonia lutea]|uniref:Ig-like domain-containing protein n=1 Tax=Hwangdonia lutea TaxID=3075823 RepID=A0AA97ELC5_9FLAO|nr:Ig-like domain-containing protein [Hwangdonia sp. SCSIO 19198]WOD43086.1 Ig-like domain-containing protein [Hwangdonia sp. SCSIO 19198]